MSEKSPQSTGPPHGGGSMSRRNFLAGAVAGSAALAAGSSFASAAEQKKQTRHEICAFVKPLHMLSFDELARRVAELGYDGIEAPLRSYAGLFELEQVPEKLPDLMSALDKHDLNLTIWASDIRKPTKAAERGLRTAAELGVKRYRLRGFKYDLSKPLTPQRDEWRKQLADLADLNRELGIQAFYQVHSGEDNVGAVVWDLPDLLRDIDREQMSVAFDIRHATVTGGQSWPQHLRMIQDHDLLGMVYVKDAIWTTGGRKLEEKNVPLGEGMVQDAFYQRLADAGYDGPISVHEEYLPHDDPKLVPKHLKAMKRDLETLKRKLKT